MKMHIDYICFADWYRHTNSALKGKLWDFVDDKWSLVSGDDLGPSGKNRLIQAMLIQISYDVTTAQFVKNSQYDRNNTWKWYMGYTCLGI